MIKFKKTMVVQKITILKNTISPPPPRLTLPILQGFLVFNRCVREAIPDQLLL